MTYIIIYASFVLSVVSFLLCVFLLFNLKRTVENIKYFDKIIDVNSETLDLHNKIFRTVLDIPQKKEETKS